MSDNVVLLKQIEELRDKAKKAADNFEVVTLSPAEAMLVYRLITRT